MFKIIYQFFDKLEDKIRGRLSRTPILYAFIGGFGIILFWRGVWHSVDYVMQRYFFIGGIEDTLSQGGLPWWDGPVSLLLGIVILLLSGIFVSSEIGNEIIISGLRGEKKLIDKTQDEIESEINSLSAIQKEIKSIRKHLAKTSKKKVFIRKKIIHK